MEKMAKNIQLKQKEMMINFMEDNYQLLFGKFSNESGRSNKDEKWKLLCVLLNDAGPPTKSIDKWKRSWLDMKSKVKEKRSKIRQHMNKTGGGPPLDFQLTTLEEKIVSICGVAAIDGDENVDEIGFETPSKQKSPLKELNVGVSARKRLFDDSADADSPITKENQPKVQRMSTPTSNRTFNAQQNQVDRALALQTETNDFLKRVVEQNDQIINLLDGIRIVLSGNQKENSN